MRVVVQRAAVFFVIALALTFWSHGSLAAENESFGIQPQPQTVNGVTRSSFEIPLETGATFQDAVRVFNKTDQPLDLSLYAADATGRGPANLAVGFRDQHPTGVGSWISISRSKVTLAPHGQSIVLFNVDVKSSNPSPAIGAIVVENTASGLAADLAERLSILVRTVPPNSPTTSTRVRPYLLRSPWVIVAIIGLVFVIALVLIGWRRSRRTRDRVVAPGEVEGADHLQAIPVASLPVIRRLGSTNKDDERDNEDRPMLDDELLVEVDEPMYIDAAEDGDDDELDEVDDEDDVDDLPPARQRGAKPAPVKRKPAARKNVAKRKPAAKRKPSAAKKKSSTSRSKNEGTYIPLDDL